MTQKEKARAYDELLVKAKKIYNEENDVLIMHTIEDLFPAFKKPDDEKIRKGLIKGLSAMRDIHHRQTFSDDAISINEALAWLEKQGSEPNWCHHKVDLSNCSEEYQKAYYDGWNNCNMQHSQCKSDGNDVVKCLINGMKFYYEDDEEATWGTDKFSMKVKDILSWLEKQRTSEEALQYVKDNHSSSEASDFQAAMNIAVAKAYDKGYNDGFKKQGEQKLVDKVEPKFREGEWLCENKVNNYAHFIQILGIVNVQGDDRYRISRDIHKGEDVVEFRFVEKYYHKFNISDAKDGDVLDANGAPFIYKKHDKDYVYFYCGVNLAGEFIEANGIDTWNNNNKVYPATKEQRDLLFKKMKEAGYEFDFEKKELKKIGNKNSLLSDFFKAEYERGKADAQKSAWSEEDEKMLDNLITYLDGRKNLLKEIKIAYIDWLKTLKPQK